MVSVDTTIRVGDQEKNTPKKMDFFRYLWELRVFWPIRLHTFLCFKTTQPGQTALHSEPIEYFPADPMSKKPFLLKGYLRDVSSQ